MVRKKVFGAKPLRFRLEDSKLKRIKELVSQAKYHDVSDFIRIAVDKELESNTPIKTEGDEKNE